MRICYNEIKKLFNYYIREYYYQKSKGTYFVYFKKPGLLFTSLKSYKKKKIHFPNIYYWYFDNLHDSKENKDILTYKNDYNIKNIYSYKINRDTVENENYVDTKNIYLNDTEQNLKNVYKTSNLYYNIDPIYLSKICLYDINDYNILFSSSYYDAFMQFYYSIISYKIDINNIKAFPNLKVLIGHIKNLAGIINDELIKNAYVYLIKQKILFNEKYLLEIFISMHRIMLIDSPLYLFVDNSDQFMAVLNCMSKDDIKNMFESAIPYPYYLTVSKEVNIHNIQSFNKYLNEILHKNNENHFTDEEKNSVSINSKSNLDPIQINVNTSNNSSATNKDKYIHDNTKCNREMEKMLNSKNEKIYFFKLIKIFDMKPNYRFIEKK